jgi:hypothetical protein
MMAKHRSDRTAERRAKQGGATPEILKFAFLPTRPAYEDLIRIAPQMQSLASLIVHPGAHGERALAALTAFTELVVSRRRVTEWPGTKLLFATAAVDQWILRLEPPVCRYLATASSPADWQHPERPEDLSFLRSDLTAWFVNIAHEGDSFVRVTQQEHTFLLQHAPIFAAALGEDRLDDGTP